MWDSFAKLNFLVHNLIILLNYELCKMKIVKIIHKCPQNAPKLKRQSKCEDIFSTKRKISKFQQLFQNRKEYVIKYSCFCIFVTKLQNFNTIFFFQLSLQAKKQNTFFHLCTYVRDQRFKFPSTRDLIFIMISSSIQLPFHMFFNQLVAFAIHQCCQGSFFLSF